MLLLFSTWMFIQSNLFLIFPLFCCIFFNYFLFKKQNYNYLVLVSFLQFIIFSFLLLSKNWIHFELFHSFSFVILFFMFLYSFLATIDFYFNFDFIFEYYLSIIYFITLFSLTFFALSVSFNLMFSLTGMFLFSTLRLLYLYFKHFLDHYFNNLNLSLFLNQWSYIWICCLSNCIISICTLYFWNFNCVILFKNLKFGFISAFCAVLGGVLFPYFLHLCDYSVDHAFSKIFSMTSEYSYRAQTFKIFTKWFLKIVFGTIYLIFLLANMSVNIYTISWNLSLIIAFGSFGFKGVIDDLVNGIFVLIDDSVNIGEFIEVANVSGRVEDVTLRVIKLRNFDGSLYVVPFRKVEIIRNRSKEFVYVVFDILVDVNINSSLVIDWLIDSFIDFKKSEKSALFFENLLEDLEVIGITAINAAGVIYQARLKIRPYNTRFIKAAYLISLKNLAKERSIGFGFEYSIINKFERT